MERTTVMKTFHGNLIPPPKSPTLKDRDASFSSYLRPEEAISCPRHLTIGLDGGCRAHDDSELSIFDAHKYFNEATNNDMQRVSISSNSRVSPLVNLNVEHNNNPEQGDIISDTRRYSSASSFDGYSQIRNYRARSFHAATPTASSEASWNSQTGLLSHPPGAISVSMKNPPHPTYPNSKFKNSLCKPIWLFRRKCPCNGKKSVEVKVTASQEQHKAQTPQAPPPPPSQPPLPLPLPPRLSHSQITRDSPILKKQDLQIPNQNTPLDKFTMNMNTVTAPANNPEAQNIPIPIIHSNNWINQSPLDQEIFIPKSQRYQTAKTKTQVPPILQPQRFLTTDNFTFPVLKAQSEIPTTIEEPPRQSLEVFRPPDSDLENPNPRKPNPRNHQNSNFPFPASPKSRGVIDDDVASDASSDLFEIESFSTSQATSTTCPIMYRRRDSLDDVVSSNNNNNNNHHHAYLYGRRSMDSTAPTITECYEPSEASIDWSVTTAEGFDRASAVNFSEITDDVNGVNGGWEVKRKVTAVNGKSLLSCRSEKAVMTMDGVGPTSVRHVSSRVGVGNSVNNATQRRETLNTQHIRLSLQ